MLMKVAGAVFVVAASAAIGLYYSGKETYRMQDLLELKKAFLILSSEIEYIATPLPEAMTHIAGRTARPVSQLFSHFAEKLTACDGETVYQLWTSSVAAHKPHSHLAAEDWEVVASFGKTLGYLDKQMQLNTIRFTVDYIDNKVSFLQNRCDKNKRMYRSLGVIGGLLLAVVLW